VNKRYVICAYRSYALELYDKLSKKYKNFILIKDRKKLNYNYIKKINPTIIFFPDWSWIVPSEIITNFKCVCFHESNLPKFRGGSPIQNQIIRGIKKTKTTAFVMTDELDAGDILLQKDLSLEGSIDNIFSRMLANDYEMINKIVKGKYKPKKQSGKPTIFKRRKPEQSELKHLNYSKSYLYNFIRMLGDPYPNAFIHIGKKQITFKSAKFDGKNLSFEGMIS
jgi:methionyl-tRNA formyltransferase